MLICKLIFTFSQVFLFFLLIFLNVRFCVISGIAVVKILALTYDQLI